MTGLPRHVILWISMIRLFAMPILIMGCMTTIPTSTWAACAAC